MTMMVVPGAGRIPEFSMGDRMRLARETSGIDQQTMADEIGVSRRSVVRYENGGAVPKSALLLWSMRTGVPGAWLETGKAPEPDDGPEGDGVPVVRLEGLEPPTFCSGVSTSGVAQVLEFPSRSLPLKKTA